MLMFLLAPLGLAQGPRLLRRLATHIKLKLENESNSCTTEEIWTKYCVFQWKTSSSTLAGSLGGFSSLITQDPPVAGENVAPRKQISMTCFGHRYFLTSKLVTMLETKVQFN